MPGDDVDVAAFRSRLVEVLAVNLDDGVHDRTARTRTLHDDALHRVLAREGLIGLGWPPEVGGAGAGPELQAEFWETVQYYGAPVDAQLLTESVGAVLLRFGSEGLRGRILPAVVSGDVLISLGYSEPDAGSDLRSVTTSAVRHADGWRISGAKVFTTMAHIADYVFLLARTSGGIGGRGVTMFLVPTDSPGFTAEPIWTFGGERTNTTFYDEVQVPDHLRVGDVDAGWPILLYGLDVERTYVGGYVGQAQRLFDDLVEALPTGPSSVAFDDLVRYAARLEAAAELTRLVFRRLARGQSTAEAAAMAKLAATETFRDLSHFALDALGPAVLACPDGDYRPAPGTFEHAFRHAQIGTVYGGSSEMQRNLIAQRALGLPRARPGSS